MEDSRIATFYSRSSILDLTPPSFHHSTFHHGLVIPLAQQSLNCLKRFATLGHALANRIDGLNEIFAFRLVQRLEQFEILKVKANQ